MATIKDFLYKREVGRASFKCHVNMSENLVIQCTEPIFADTPIRRSPTFVLQINCDNKLIAAGHENYSVTIYDALSGQVLAICNGHELSPWTLSVSLILEV